MAKRVDAYFHKTMMESLPCVLDEDNGDAVFVERLDMVELDEYRALVQAAHILRERIARTALAADGISEDDQTFWEQFVSEE